MHVGTEPPQKSEEVATSGVALKVEACSSDKVKKAVCKEQESSVQEQERSVQGLQPLSD